MVKHVAKVRHSIILSLMADGDLFVMEDSNMKL